MATLKAQNLLAQLREYSFCISNKLICILLDAVELYAEVANCHGSSVMSVSRNWDVTNLVNTTRTEDATSSICP